MVSVKHVLSFRVYELNAHIRDITYDGGNVPEPFLQVSDEPVAFCTSVQSTREFRAFAVLRPCYFRQSSHDSSHTKRTGHYFPRDRSLCRGIDREEDCIWYQITLRSGC